MAGNAERSWDCGLRVTVCPAGLPVPRSSMALGRSWPACRSDTEVSLSKTPKELQERAEAQFKKKEAQAREGAKARADYEAQQRAVSEKTARLKALRLAKEASEPEVKKKPLAARKSKTRI